VTRDDGRRWAASGSPFEATIGFSRAVRVGARVVVSGSAPIWPDGTCPDDAGIQARRCLEIVLEALEALGASAGRARPAATMVVVAGLLDPRWKVEIEAEAVVEAQGTEAT
jgi:enamine deaminase RidA (YjgF/YER057c/UK114 family)